jgi:hypothetical protein
MYILISHYCKNLSHFYRSFSLTTSAAVVDEWLRKTHPLCQRRNLQGRLIVGVVVQWGPFNNHEHVHANTLSGAWAAAA